MAQDSHIEITIDGEKIAIDPTDIDGVEWRDIKRQTGMQPRQVFDAAEQMDFEAIAALVWIVKRRDDTDLDFEAVLSGLSMASLVGDDEDDEPAPSGSGANSES